MHVWATHTSQTVRDIIRCRDTCHVATGINVTRDALGLRGAITPNNNQSEAELGGPDQSEAITPNNISIR